MNDWFWAARDFNNMGKETCNNNIAWVFNRYGNLANSGPWTRPPKPLGFLTKEK